MIATWAFADGEKNRMFQDSDEPSGLRPQDRVGDARRRDVGLPRLRALPFGHPVGLVELERRTLQRERLARFLCRDGERQRGGEGDGRDAQLVRDAARTSARDHAYPQLLTFVGRARARGRDTLHRGESVLESTGFRLMEPYTVWRIRRRCV
ncbi:MAG: hypothetical protein IPG84_14530 [Betaproteobacteria bacterium]|nr:hypothetical protein [Betaproteobacteria bacterium]